MSDLDGEDENEQASQQIPNPEQQQIINSETGLLEPLSTSNLEDQHVAHEVTNERRIIINPESGILEEVLSDTECEEDITIRRKGKKKEQKRYVILRYGDKMASKICTISPFHLLWTYWRLIFINSFVTCTNVQTPED